MGIFYLIAGFICAACILLILFLYRKLNISKTNFKELEQKKAEELGAYFSGQSEAARREHLELQIQNQRYRSINSELQRNIAENNRILDKMTRQGIESVNRDIERERQTQLKFLEIEIAEKRKIVNKDMDQLKDDYEKQKIELTSVLNELKADITDFHTRREAINRAISLENSKEEELDKHRILLPQQDKQDISYLLSIESKINNKQLLRKLIWGEYLQQPFNDMLKRLFLGAPPKNVIYCIENISNHKKYIGKTTAEVSKRWTEHIKASLDIGTIKSQSIHKALCGHWDEFTFSVIVETEKEKISSQEKYYIDLFESNVYGYNMKSGG